ncbi:MAG: hypothetical protein AAF282_24115 [Cyanobacteria bacterium P01_A01_bin.15]
MAPYRRRRSSAGERMKKRIKADRASVVAAIATLTLVAVVALASPGFSP